jgi:hypothetical protein
MPSGVKKKPSTNIPPFRNRAQVPRNIDNGHYPFNTRSERRLPWDSERDTPAESSRCKKKQTKPIRPPHRPPTALVRG